MKFDKNSLLLYAVTDRAWVGKQTLFEQVKDAIKGGITCLQIREKNLDNELFLQEAKKLKELCHSNNIPFIVNDNVEIAVKCGADGIHIGQEDTDAAEVRKIIGNDMFLGVSAQTPQQAVKAERDGADYLGVGAVFPTSTKKDAAEVPYDTLKEICSSVKIPTVAIGGITKNNIPMLSDSGICGIAVISAIFAAEDIEKECRELKEITKNSIN